MTITSKKRILVDTNILAYLSDKESPFFEKVFRFFSLCEENGTKIVMAQQNVIELVRTLVRDYGLTLPKSLEKVRLLLSEREFEIIHPFPSTLDLYFQLVSSGSKGTFDLYMASTAIDNGVDCIVTNDPKGFKGIKGLEVLSLRDIDELVGGKIQGEHE